MKKPPKPPPADAISQSTKVRFSYALPYTHLTQFGPTGQQHSVARVSSQSSLCRPLISHARHAVGFSRRHFKQAGQRSFYPLRLLLRRSVRRFPLSGTSHRRRSPCRNRASFLLSFHNLPLISPCSATSRTTASKSSITSSVPAYPPPPLRSSTAFLIILPFLCLPSKPTLALSLSYLSSLVNTFPAFAAFPGIHPAPRSDT